MFLNLLMNRLKDKWKPSLKLMSWDNLNYLGLVVAGVLGDMIINSFSFRKFGQFQMGHVLCKVLSEWIHLCTSQLCPSCGSSNDLWNWGNSLICVVSTSNSLSLHFSYNHNINQTIIKSLPSCLGRQLFKKAPRHHFHCSLFSNCTSSKPGIYCLAQVEYLQM